MSLFAVSNLDYERKRARALRWQWLRTYLSCAYCGKLLSWRWKWQGLALWLPVGNGNSVALFALGANAFERHRLLAGACQCERIGGHPPAAWRLCG